ncbi:MAG: PAS domain-containing protein [Chthoniobacterales bacterium]|nr:PAS domain-containing protein [Chthoniobacterales bacterium]
MQEIAAPPIGTDRARSLFRENLHAIHCRADRLFAGLMILQWIAGIAIAVWISPRTWIGAQSLVHWHVWAAIFLGGALASLPVYLALRQPGTVLTRHTVAVSQTLYSALLIHLTGGRIETHFHVFGSLAFLAFYRDWRVLATATAVVALDHATRGIFWPLSAFGTLTTSPWRWIEHAGWVLFEDVFLFLSITQSTREMREVATRRINLEISEERLAEAQRVAEVGSFDLDLATLEAVWSDEQFRLLGYAPGEIASNYGNFLTRVHPEDCAVAEKFMETTLADGQSGNVDLRIVLPDGSVRVLQRRARVILDDAGTATRMVGTTQDITERVRVEQELKKAKVAAAVREGEERYTFLADAVPQIVWTARPDGGLDYYNKAWFDYTGLTLEQTRDSGWRDLLHADDLQPCVERWTAALTTGNKFESEHRFKRGADGTYRWHFVQALPMRNEAGEIMQWVGTCTDIDDAKRSEEKLTTLNAELGLRVLERTSELQAAKEVAESANRAKSEFLANMGHEIRTPMNGIIGMTDLVLESELDPGQQEYLGMVKTSANSLLHLINDILDFSKIEAGKVEFEAINFSLRDSLRDLLKPLSRRAAQKQLKLISVIPASIPEDLRGDPLRLGQILTNLVGNAIKFTERGDIVVAVEVEPRRSQCTTLDPAEHCLHFSVADTGIGIAPEKQEVIFDAFAQADGSTTRHYGGTGLGLAIASQLIQQMGGRIWLESEVGKGTTFHFSVAFKSSSSSLPSPDLRTRTRTKDEDDYEKKSGALRILIAEDNAINRAVATGILEKRGYELTHVENGRAALEVFIDESFDVVLMDIQMPEMDGLEATRRIREMEVRNDTPRTPIVAMTAHAMAGDRERCLAAGMDDYISKPLQKEKLLEVIARISQSPSSSLPSPSSDLRTRTITKEDDSPGSVFSREKLLEQLDNDEELLEQMVTLFRDGTPRLLEEIRDAIAREDAAAVARAAHALLSSLGAFGAQDAYRLARELEEMGSGRNLMDAAPVFLELKAEADRIYGALVSLECATA